MAADMRTLIVVEEFLLETLFEKQMVWFGMVWYCCMVLVLQFFLDGAL